MTYIVIISSSISVLLTIFDFGLSLLYQNTDASQNLIGSNLGYYIDPTELKSNTPPLLQILRKARNGMIFGQPGSGKTTLRYILEAECRSVYDHTLAVTYELSHKVEHPRTAEEHYVKLAQELAIDLFIQVIEQLDTFEAPTDIQKEYFKAQMALIWPRLRRTVNLILTDRFSNRSNGLATLWPRLNRPVVRYITQSSKITNLIKECMPEQTKPLGSQSGETLLKAGIAAAKAWGFKQIFVVVDGVDALEREVDSMLALISPLLNNLEKWQLEKLSFYFFLTSDMHPSLTETYRKILDNLPFSQIWHIINWDESSLKTLLHQRLRAASSRIPGFNALATSKLGHNLEDTLIEAAQYSPRQLLRLVSALIDAHAQNEPDQLLITAEDWQYMQQSWSYNLPLPPDLVANGLSP